MKNMRFGWLLSFAIFAINFARAEPVALSREWREYLARSSEEMAADRNAIYAELEGGTSELRVLPG